MSHFYEIELKKMLIQMGITPNYVGYAYIILAMQDIFQKPECLQHVTKELYPSIAKQCNTNWKTVEHGIRIAIASSWKRRCVIQEKLFVLCDHEKPSVGKFLAILYTYLELLREIDEYETSKKILCNTKDIFKNNQCYNHIRRNMEYLLQ